MTRDQYLQDGFNAGYQLQQHKPELAAHLQKGFANKQHPYARGFSSGQQQYIKEQSQEQSRHSSSRKDSYHDRLKQQIKTKSSHHEQTKSRTHSNDRGREI